MSTFKIIAPIVFFTFFSCRQADLVIPDSFEIEEGFNLSLVASEPLIKDPVDLKFDEKGNALVLEMPGYPYEDRQSRIVMLKDTDKDGIYDDNLIFADSLQLASSILPYNGGVLVAAPPYLLHVFDMNGDNTADKVDTLMGGFSTGNLQHNYNGLTFGLDGWIYAANGGNSGKPFWWGDPDNFMDLRGQDMRINIVKRVIERIGRSSGGFELAIDEWGRIFETHNLEHISQLVFPGRYIGETSLTIRHSLHNVSDHEENGLSRIYPIGEQETRVNHPEQSGYFSGSCGITYYGGGALGEEYNNTVWVTDVVLNLVHVDKLKPEGSAFTATRALHNKDFLASTDRSSRPVNMTVGPDGAFYLVDMYREVIEHPEWIPDDMEATMDLNAGKDKGKIYRITHRSEKVKSFKTEKFETPEGMITSLGHSNQWVRNTAHRMLLEEELSDDNVQNLITNIKGDIPLARLHSLWVLHGMEQLGESLVLQALDDTQSEIRENVLIMAEKYIDISPSILKACIERLGDENQRVRMQAALTISRISKETFQEHSELIISSLVKSAALTMDQWNIAAVSLAARHSPHSLLKVLDVEKPSSKNLMVSLATQCTGIADRGVAVLQHIESMGAGDDLKAEVVNAMVAEGVTFMKSEKVNQAIMALEKSSKTGLLTALTGIRRAIGLPVSQAFVDMSRQALSDAANTSLSDSIRLSQLNLISLLPYQEKSQVLYSCLNNREALSIQQSALEQLWQAQDPEIGKRLVDNWKSLGPQARKRAGDILLYKKAHHDALLTGLENGIINIGEMNFDLERRRTLLWWTDDENTKRRAEALFSDSGVVNRKEAIDKMRPALALMGNPAKGQVVYANICSQCHVFGDVGTEVGPVLTEINRKSKESLLYDILDPNAAVDTKFINHRIETKEGVIHVGMIDQETDTEVTIKQIGGATITVNKSDIKDFSSMGSSLMMEGLEAGMSTQDMADLLEYLTNLTQ